MVLGPDDAVLGQFDGSPGEGTNVRTTLELPQSGSYTLGVTSARPGPARPAATRCRSLRSRPLHSCDAASTMLGSGTPIVRVPAPSYLVRMTNQPRSKGGGVYRADNRKRLVEAGYEVLSEKGFEATTVKEIWSSSE